MKKFLIISLILVFPFVVFAQDNAGAEKPAAAVQVIKEISDSFLPGVFTGVESIIGQVKEKKKNKESLDKAKKDIENLKNQNKENRKEAKNALNNLKSYYRAEAKDFKTLNAIFNKVSIFSTKVGSLVMLSDIINNSQVAYASDDSRNVVVNNFKDAANATKNAWTNIVETSFVSDNKLLNAQVLSEKRKIDRILERMSEASLTISKTYDMTGTQIDNYFSAVKDVRNNGDLKFSDMENSVRLINTYLTSYLIDFQSKSESISNSIDITIKSFEEAEK